jgi:transposase-like protein
MAGKRKTYPPALKAQVALAALQAGRTVNEVAAQYGLHPNLVRAWKKQLLARAEDVFGTQPEAAQTEAELGAELARLKMELEWLKQKAALFD